MYNMVKYQQSQTKHRSVDAQEKVVKQHLTQRKTRNFFETGTKTSFFILKLRRRLYIYIDIINLSIRKKHYNYLYDVMPLKNHLQLKLNLIV